MVIGGLQKFSLLDYPGHLSAIIFTQGCNFRCPFCYNPMLVWPAKVGKIENTLLSKDESGQEDHPENLENLISQDDLFVFLKARQGKLDAVVITGGEPTLHVDLPDFISAIRDLGYKIKLDTNGTNPKMLAALIEKNLIDYIAMDLKGPFDKYDLTSGVQPDLDKIKESVNIIMKSGLPYEFRTTVVPELLSLEDIQKMGEEIKGAEKWFLQQFKSDTDLVNPRFQGQKGYTFKQMQEMKETAKKFVKICEVR